MKKVKAMASTSSSFMRHGYDKMSKNRAIGAVVFEIRSHWLPKCLYVNNILNLCPQRDG
jgi:hypothetical protein